MSVYSRYDGIPEKLEHLLLNYKGSGRSGRSRAHRDEDARKAIYKRMYGILWVSILLHYIMDNTLELTQQYCFHTRLVDALE